MVISIGCYRIFAKYLVDDENVLAYSLGYSKKSAERHLMEIRNFHRLPGVIVESESLDEEFSRKIREKLTKNTSFVVNLEVYRFSRVYKILLSINLGETISYKVLSKKSGYPIPLVIRALKYNPFPILIPCHRVIRSDGSLSGYTPLGPEFKKMLLDLEGRADLNT